MIHPGAYRQAWKSKGKSARVWARGRSARKVPTGGGCSRQQRYPKSCHSIVPCTEFLIKELARNSRDFSSRIYPYIYVDSIHGPILVTYVRIENTYITYSLYVETGEWKEGRFTDKLLQVYLLSVIVRYCSIYKADLHSHLHPSEPVNFLCTGP